MSSGFVPASGSTTAPSNDNPTIPVNDEWEAAKASIEQRRRERENASHQENSKSLFETLQANKAAKQEVFEESIRLKNQFRSLDEDEVEFLDSVLESTRKREQEVKKETSEMLEVFRRQQEEADKLAVAGSEEGSATAEASAGSRVLPAENGENWGVAGKKRKKGPGRDKEGVLKGVKIRRTSSSAQDANGASTAPAEGVKVMESGGKPADQDRCDNVKAPVSAEPVPASNADGQSTAPKKAPSTGILGLDYASDTSDD